MDIVQLIRRTLLLWCGILFLYFVMSWQHAHAGPPQACPDLTEEFGRTGGFSTASQALDACNRNSGSRGGAADWHDRYQVTCQLVASEKRVRQLWVHTAVYQNCTTQYEGADASKNFVRTGWQYTEDCPADRPLDPETGVCTVAECPGGAIKMTNGSCSPKPEECSARNAEPGFIGVGDTTRNFSSHCVGGCQFSVTGPHTTTTHGSRTMVTGTFEFTGSVCGASPQSPPQPDSDVKPAKAQECSPAGAQQDFCVKANGDHCATSAAGRQICWKPGETGEKVDGKTLQKRQPGETPTPPRTPPPDGDEWTAPKEAIKTTTESKSADGTTTNTITTIITNQSTKSGVNAGKTNQGEKGDGSGDDKGESEDGEKGQFSADCAKQPTCSQTDGIGCAMVRQQWSNKCDALQGDVNQIGNTNELPTQGLESSLIDVWDQGNGYIPGPTDIDKTGWAGRGSCPINIEFTALKRSYNINHPQLCEILDALAALIMIVGSWHAGFILTTGFRKG